MQTNWANAARDHLTMFFVHLNVANLGRCSSVNKRWKLLLNDASLWKMLLCRDLAFGAGQIEHVQNPKDLFKANWILRTNLAKNRFLSNIFTATFDLRNYKFIERKGFMVTTRPFQSIVLVDINQNNAATLSIPFDDLTPNGPYTECLDKDIIVCKAKLKMLIMRASDGKCLKEFAGGMVCGNINDDLMAYFDMSDKSLRFFNLSTHQEHPLSLSKLPSLVTECVLMENTLVFCGPLRPKCWVKGFDFVTGTPLFEFQPPSSQVRIMPIGKGCFALYEQETICTPDDVRWTKNKLMGIYDQKIGNQLDIKFPPVNTLFPDKYEAPEGLIVFKDDQEANVIQVWDVEEKKMIQKLILPNCTAQETCENHILSRNRLLTLTFSLKTECLQSLCIWNLNTGEMIKELDVHGMLYDSLDQGILCVVQRQWPKFFGDYLKLTFIDLFDGSVLKTEETRAIPNHKETYAANGKFANFLNAADGTGEFRSIQERDYTKFLPKQ